MRRSRWLVAVMCLVVVAGCGREDDGPSRPVLPEALTTAGPAVGGRPIDNLPATFTGVLPCADCPGIDHILNLQPDQTFVLRAVYRDRGPDATREAIGRWVVGSDGRILMLEVADGAPQFFAMIDRTTLRQLDTDAQPIASSANHDLTRAAEFRPIEFRAPMRGEFVYLADAGMFTECGTGRRWPTAMEGAHAELERVYLADRSAPGAPLVVRLEGRVVQRERMEGDGTEAAVVVDRVIETRPGERCEPPAPPVALEDTDWRLTQVRGAPVSPTGGAAGRAGTPGDAGAGVPGEAGAGVEAQPEPGLRLQSGTGQFAGSGGCNRLLGTFRREGAAISLTPTVTTRMVCPARMETEETLMGVFADVRRWRILGRRLELMDADGAVLARFEPRSP